MRTQLSILASGDVCLNIQFITSYSMNPHMHHDIVIRDARLAEFPEILRINAESSPGVTRLTGSDITSLTGTGALAWVAVADRKVAGYLIAFLSSASYDGEEFIWFSKQMRDFVYIDQLALARSYRRRGIGRALYTALERWAVGLSCRSLSCEVNINPPNPVSLAFHASYGFAEISRMHTADGRHVALLKKELTVD
jgi:uncharacterized protein